MYCHPGACLIQLLHNANARVQSESELSDLRVERLTQVQLLRTYSNTSTVISAKWSTAYLFLAFTRIPSVLAENLLLEASALVGSGQKRPSGRSRRRGTLGVRR